MQYFDYFVVPFIVGATFLFAVIIWKWLRWLFMLPRSDKRLIGRNIFSVATLRAIWEVVSESLLHRKIFKVNPLLGFMHMSLAFGWFLLIVMGWVEAYSVIGGGNGLHTHVFFRFFDPQIHEGVNVFSQVMDGLLLLVLIGVALAWFKRARSKALGMRRTTKHVPIDRVALTSLWFIFPLRLVAESFTAAVKNNGGFLTGSIGNWLATMMDVATLDSVGYLFWWLYSITLGVFFVAMPFSRYMHILTEIPLIFLRNYKLKSSPSVQTSFDDFQIQACSRCGICLDPCQLQKDLGLNTVQSVYFLRDRRYGKLTTEVLDNCLMCGACEVKCPVGIDLNTLRQNSRVATIDTPANNRYSYLKGADKSSGEGRVGYFAGCMTLLTPATLQSMEKIFSAAGEDVWWADRDGGSCCGRPLKLAGEVTAAQKMMDCNKELFSKHAITTLVTSCPICLKVFKEDYALKGIEVLHHTEYIERLIAEGRLKIAADVNKTYTYHDPCELGRGAGIYESPRNVIKAVGVLAEPAKNRKDALCCGSSLANTAINDGQQLKIATALAEYLESTGADTIVTACPLCKKAIVRGTQTPVQDISQIIAQNIIR